MGYGYPNGPFELSGSSGLGANGEKGECPQEVLTFEVICADFDAQFPEQAGQLLSFCNGMMEFVDLAQLDQFVADLCDSLIKVISNQEQRTQVIKVLILPYQQIYQQRLFARYKV